MNAEDRYDSLFRFYAWKSGVDWRLLKAQAKAESALNPDARSRVGAKGLSQFMARTWEEWRDGTAGLQPPPDLDVVLLDPRDPEDAIRAQAAFMAWLLRSLGRDVERALAGYNWGIGSVRRAVATYGPAWLDHAPDETQGYIRRIKRMLEEMPA